MKRVRCFSGKGQSKGWYKNRLVKDKLKSLNWINEGKCKLCGEKPTNIDKTPQKSEFYNSIVVPAVKRRAKGKCETCGAKEPLEVHHLRYGNDITISDLKAICKKCHLKEHGKEIRVKI